MTRLPRPLLAEGSLLDEAQRVRRERLRWHCRRALLELDIVFQRFWQRTGDELDDDTATQLERLLELEDHDLWDLVSGRTSTEDPQLGSMIESLRAQGAADGRQQLQSQRESK